MAHMGPADTIRVLTEAKNQALEQIQRLMTTLKLLMEVGAFAGGSGIVLALCWHCAGIVLA
jgi:hypothetical protein